MCKMKLSSLLTCICLVAIGCDAYVQKKNITRDVNNQFPKHPSHIHHHGEASKHSITDGMGRLATSLLHDVNVRAGNRFNIVLSPFSIWTILALLLEGSAGRTEQELKAKLNVSSSSGRDDGRRVVESQYEELARLFQGDHGQTEFTSLNYVISDKKLSPEFQAVVDKYYDAKYFTYDPRRKGLFAIMVNSWAADKSNGRLMNIVTPEILDNLVLLIGNSVYFKSKWKYPFDPLDTITLPFKDDTGEVITNIPTMNLAAVLPLGYNKELESQIIEIPYADNATSMVVILPQQNVGLRTTLSRMKNQSLKDVIPINMSEETVQLSLPRFHIFSKMLLNDVLGQDLPSAFSSQTAEFPRMGKDVFVSRIYHKAEIENTEEGTTASAVTKTNYRITATTVDIRTNHRRMIAIGLMLLLPRTPWSSQAATDQTAKVPKSIRKTRCTKRHQSENGRQTKIRKKEKSTDPLPASVVMNNRKKVDLPQPMTQVLKILTLSGGS